MSVDEQKYYHQEIAVLDSMFGGTVSAAVIESVIYSCDGNVHLAADAIMNFSDEISTPHPEESATESKNEEPAHVTSLLNVEAPPFEFHQLPANVGNQSMEELKSTNFQPPRISGRLSPTFLRQQSHNPKQELPTSATLQVLATAQTRQQSHTNATLQSPLRPQPSTSSRQQLSTIMNQKPLPTLNQQPPATTNSLSIAEALSASSQAFRNSGTIPKKPPDTIPHKASYTQKNVWPDQIGKILHYHNEGTRTLIIMRGPAGSGKTYLAKHIVEYTVGPSSQNFADHIFSSDSFFMRGGIYKFNRESLEQAHAMNQRRVCEATHKGVSPIIVDNTNTELWEMEPYIRDGVRNGYIIEFVEPNTPWAKNVNQLTNRNVHGVSRESIRRMLDRYDKKITSDIAIKSLRLSYPPNKKPPTLRNIPPLSTPQPFRNSPKRENPDKGDGAPNISYNVTQNTSRNSTVERSNSGEIKDSSVRENTPSDDDAMPNAEHEIKVKKIIDAQKKIEQFEIVEREWENGESWDVGTNISRNYQPSKIATSSPKPARVTEKLSNKAKNMIEPNIIGSDWTKISMFMPPWEDAGKNDPVNTINTPAMHVESNSVGTGFEIGDFNEHNHKILYTKSRDINHNIPAKTKPKNHIVIMLDKSTATHENDFLSYKAVCKNKEKHFKELRRMFKSVPRDVLRDIFESCNFDVNWVVNLVLDSPESYKHVDIENVSDSEEDEGGVSECNCLAGYNIIPDATPILKNIPDPEPVPIPTNAAPVLQKKTKRDAKLSDNKIKLKRHIESNVMISEHNYSQHYLNMRKRRENNIDGLERDRGMSRVDTEDATEVHTPIVESEIVENTTTLPETSTQTTQNMPLPIFPGNFGDVAGPSTSFYNLQFMNADPADSDSESDSTKSDSMEKTVTVNLGREFVSKLDELFGRKDFQYPGDVQPVVNLPMSLLQQINAHWAMSVASQLDDGSRQSEAMIKQDEDFARQLAAKEQEMSEEGREPEIPSLKEIMDMEIAYAIYKRGIAEWRNNEPQDMAAKMSREKLYNLFPDLSQEVLSEMLMAHEYSFKATIESLIVSTGQSQWLEDEKGVEKFVMQKEMERKEKFVEEQNKNLDEEESPYLSKPEMPVTLETVNYYRAEAERSLQCRNQNFEKARLYFARNSPSAAAFYSEIAALHKRKYENYSSLAASYLMHYHLKNNPHHDVLDLHFLRVGEALVNLDIFLDEIILKLRTKNISSKDTWIITGKGTHSVGGPRIKPAAKRRLNERGITVKQINGGLFMATLYPTNKLTSELTSERS